CFVFSSRGGHTIFPRDWSADVGAPHLPGGVATLRPTWKADSSVCEIRPRARSPARFSRPARRLSPRVSWSRRCASGLVTRKFAGDMASIHCWVVNRIRSRALASPSTESASRLRNSELSSYMAAIHPKGPPSCQLGSAKRRPLGSALPVPSSDCSRCRNSACSSASRCGATPSVATGERKGDADSSASGASGAPAWRESPASCAAPFRAPGAALRAVVLPAVALPAVALLAVVLPAAVLRAAVLRAAGFVLVDFVDAAFGAALRPERTAPTFAGARPVLLAERFATRRSSGMPSPPCAEYEPLRAILHCGKHLSIGTKPG